MNTMKTSMWVAGCVVASAVAWAPLASGAPSLSSPEMKTAFAKAAQGPESLRRYVERTKPIYMLDYNEVMALAYPERMSAADSEVRVADNTRR